MVDLKSGVIESCANSNVISGNKDHNVSISPPAAGRSASLPRCWALTRVII